MRTEWGICFRSLEMVEIYFFGEGGGRDGKKGKELQEKEREDVPKDVPKVR